MQDMEFLTPLILCLSLSYLFLSPPPVATTPTGTIERTIKQQIIASIPPNTGDNSVPFITSPSGKYTAYLLRHETNPGAGGFGNDFCYIEVQDTGSEQSVWESECAPVSTANTCTLVFDEYGLDIFDGSHPAWYTGARSADDHFLETLELVDEGDMRIRDKDGELAWKASDSPRANQACGLPGSPGLAPAHPPFAVPIGGGGNLPFGQSSEGEQQQLPQPGSSSLDNQQQQQQPLNGVSQSFGFDSQPLVDNNRYDSGCFRGVEGWIGMGVALLFALLGYAALH